MPLNRKSKAFGAESGGVCVPSNDMFTKVKQQSWIKILHSMNEMHENVIKSYMKLSAIMYYHNTNIKGKPGKVK